MPRVHVVIPARFDSSRLPGKPLAVIAGKPMIQHVYERAKASDLIDGVTVATDDKRVVDAVKLFGGNVQLTSSSHSSGTARVAEVARSLSADIIVNLQGDEPLIRPEEIEKVVAPLINNKEVTVSSLMTPFQSMEEYLRPSSVKVLCNELGMAIYFSRWPLPFDSSFWKPNDGPIVEQWISYFGRLQEKFDLKGLLAQRHIGIYSFQRDVLLDFVSREPAKLDQAEQLEQLKLLHYGTQIRMVSTSHQGRGVDTPADLEAVRKLMESL
ncbi:MAG TPA: 3-deoxy-manno-octulosonate cytidylyltransferase [Bdellovibrionota bacterium]|nr:3-deoxy-manno-octulosonate cytidylyltransferase [Bdellovibrionota bacterium]